jgi:hypothetical protein
MAPQRDKKSVIRREIVRQRQTGALVASSTGPLGTKLPVILRRADAYPQLIKQEKFHWLTLSACVSYVSDHFLQIHLAAMLSGRPTREHRVCGLWITAPADIRMAFPL